MDPGSAAALVDDPRGSLERLKQTAGTSFRHLAEARRHTDEQVHEKVAALPHGNLAADMSVVVFGSWARDELTEGSDDDQDVERALTRAREHLGGDERQPGAQAVFGVAFDIPGLVHNIGLDQARNGRMRTPPRQVEGLVRDNRVEVRVVFGASSETASVVISRGTRDSA